MAESNYTLNYFNLRARGELIRLVFTAAGAKFTDNRIEYGSDWSEVKATAPLGQLPFLDIDGVKIPQSVSLARFVAKQFNLAGNGNVAQAQTDAIVDTLMECFNGYFRDVFLIKDDEEKKAVAVKKFLEVDIIKTGESVEKLITLYGSNGFSVGDSLTWADLALFDLAPMTFSKVPELAEKFPKIAAVVETVTKNDLVAEYVKNRPVTPL